MKKLFFWLPLLFAAALSAQTPYEFKEVKTVKATPVKSQDQTGTCWAFSTASLLESEVIRMGKAPVDLSEMYVVRNIYRDKAENFVRRQGTAQLGEGGLAHDLLNAVREHGLMTEQAYPGRKDPSKPFNHSGLEQKLKELCSGMVDQGKQSKLAANWLGRIDSLLDVEFGKVPNTFVENGVQYTPQSFRDFLGINPDDYVNITSFSHHPFYTSFILEIPDNFANGSFYNLPLGEMMRCLNYAIQNGYSVEWDADVSNRGFSTQNGLAIVPEKEWKDKTTAEQANSFKFWEDEKEVSQAYRQEMFDRQITTDDHLMHITGITDETQSGLFYTVKNSWGANSGVEGYLNVSENYMRLNTISFTIHKNALPSDIRKRMGIEPGQVTIEQTKATNSTTTQPTGKTAPATIQKNMRATEAAPAKATPGGGSKQ